MLAFYLHPFIILFFIHSYKRYASNAALFNDDNSNKGKMTEEGKEKEERKKERYYAEKTERKKRKDNVPGLETKFREGRMTI